LNPELPEKIEGLLQKALDKDRNLRCAAIKPR
jgi:hypothetical protein